MSESAKWRSGMLPDNKRFRVWIAAAAILVLPGCGGGRTSDEGRIYTLYRNSTADSNLRMHVATFDAAAKEDYNSANCEQARELFQGQPGVRARYWCEKGAFRK
jgi:hypothetical protein